MKKSSSPTKRRTASQVARASRSTRIRNLLVAARESGSYPLTVEQIAMQLGEIPADTLRFLASKTQQGEFLLAAKDASAPVSLREDLRELLESEAVWKFAAARVSAKRRQKGSPLRSDAKKFATDAGLVKELSDSFLEMIEQRRTSRTLPEEVADQLALSPSELANQLFQIISSRSHASSDDSPLPQRTLFALAGCDGKQPSTRQALQEPAFANHVIACHDAPSKEPAYFLRENLVDRLPALAVRGIEQILAKLATTPGKTSGRLAKSTLFTATEVATAVTKEKSLHAELAAGFERAAEQQALGGKLAWLYAKGKRLYFRRQDIEPAGLWRSTPDAAGFGEKLVTTAGSRSQLATGQPAPADFAVEFDRVFAQVDARSGGRNFVKVLDLRMALPQFGRVLFDAGLRELRMADRYTMESAHGGAVRLTEEELRAGIQEGSSLLVYVSRK